MALSTNGDGGHRCVSVVFLLLLFQQGTFGVGLALLFHRGGGGGGGGGGGRSGLVQMQASVVGVVHGVVVRRGVVIRVAIRLTGEVLAHRIRRRARVVEDGGRTKDGKFPIVNES